MFESVMMYMFLITQLMYKTRSTYKNYFATLTKKIFTHKKDPEITPDLLHQTYKSKA